MSYYKATGCLCIEKRDIMEDLRRLCALQTETIKEQRVKNNALLLELEIALKALENVSEGLIKAIE
jgi:hypothetical protein